MQKTVCNIPHSGRLIPPWAKEDMLISGDALRRLTDFMADLDVDQLWSFVPEENKEVAEISRLVLDTERFRNDTDEAMAAKGMGLYYTHTPEGTPFRRKTEISYRKCLSLYDAYHKSLEEKVTKCLREHGKCIILDCHSFHDEMTYTGYDPADFPDVCVGINGECAPEARAVIDAFASKGYQVGINVPFSGALVPLAYQQDPRVVSVMVELNRRIYTGTSFGDVQKICREIYDRLNL